MQKYQSGNLNFSQNESTTNFKNLLNLLYDPHPPYLQLLRSFLSLFIFLTLNLRFMKKRNLFLCTALVALTLFICRKEIDQPATAPGEIAGTPLPGQTTYCRIESLWENPGMPNQRFILFLYDEYENPVAITTPLPSTGHPFHTFKYDTWHRLRQYRGEYSNGNYEFWHFYGFDLNGRIGVDTMYTLGAMGPTGPAT